MTAEQKLEKCKELVRGWMKEKSDREKESRECRFDGLQNKLEGSAHAFHVCANELQAVLEETDE